MPRPLWLKVLIGLWAVWFNAALLEAPGVHACAVHSGAGAMAHGGHTADMAMTGHDGHAATAPSHETTHQCSCLGVCCSVTPATVPSTSWRIVAHYAAPAPAQLGAFIAAPVRDRPHERPFANGPPRLV